MFKLLLLLCLFLPVSAAKTVVVGSRDFPESVLLAEILSTAIEQNTDIKVDRKFHLGGVKVCITAMQSGALDLYPDYTGSLMHNLLGEKEPAEYYRSYLETELERNYNFVITDKLGFDNSFVLVVTRDFADKYRLKTLSDLQLLLMRDSGLADRLRVAFKHSFIARPDGYLQLQKVYGFNFSDIKPMEYNIAYTQLKAGRIDIIDAFSTDARLLDSDLVVLVDDRHALLPYDSVFVSRKSIVDKYPELSEVFASLNNKLDNSTMLKLNREVASGKTYHDVAVEFLGTAGGHVSAPISDNRFINQDLSMLLRALKQHLALSGLALFLAILFGVFIGFLIYNFAGFAKIVLALASITQVIPSLALLALLIPILGLGFKPALMALFIYALLPIIQNTYAGLQSIAPEYIDLAKSLALSPWRIISRVQLMIAAPSIIAGIRTSSVICIGAATLATFVGAGGLGDLIKAGIDLNSNYLILLGAIPAALMALLVSLALSWLEKAIRS